MLKTHVKVLAVIYLCFGILLGIFCLAALASALAGANPYAGEALPPVIGLIVWLLLTGRGLWRFTSNGWLFGLITGGVLMLALHSLFLFADDGNFVRSNGQKIFHLVCMAIGLYTLIILLLPKARALFKN